MVFLAGALFGGLVVGNVTSTSKESSEQTNAPLSDKELASRKAERLESSYKEAVADMEQDVKSGKITQEKADEIKAKLEEAYNFVKTNPGTNSAERAEIRAKRREWREWAVKNDVPSTYFIRIY